MPSTYRVAVIGSTGQGNYGHGLDMVWKNLPHCDVVAVADDHPDGLANAKRRLGVRQTAADPSRFGITLKGRRGMITMETGFLPKAYWLANPSWSTGRNKKSWTPISSNGPGKPESLEDGGLQACNVLVCHDLIAAIEDDRQPESNLADACLTKEMILGVFESHRTGKRISFPMNTRQYPLTLPFGWKGS